MVREMHITHTWGHWLHNDSLYFHVSRQDSIQAEASKDMTRGYLMCITFTSILIPNCHVNVSYMFQ